MDADTTLIIVDVCEQVASDLDRLNAAINDTIKTDLTGKAVIVIGHAGYVTVYLQTEDIEGVRVNFTEEILDAPRMARDFDAIVAFIKARKAQLGNRFSDTWVFSNKHGVACAWLCKGLTSSRTLTLGQVSIINIEDFEPATDSVGSPKKEVVDLAHCKSADQALAAIGNAMFEVKKGRVAIIMDVSRPDSDNEMEVRLHPPAELLATDVARELRFFVNMNPIEAVVIDPDGPISDLSFSAVLDSIQAHNELAEDLPALQAATELAFNLTRTNSFEAEFAVEPDGGSVALVTIDGMELAIPRNWVKPVD